MIAFSRKGDHKRCAVTGRQWGNKPQANVDGALDRSGKKLESRLSYTKRAQADSRDVTGLLWVFWCDVGLRRLEGKGEKFFFLRCEIFYPSVSFARRFAACLLDPDKHKAEFAPRRRLRFWVVIGRFRFFSSLCPAFIYQIKLCDWLRANTAQHFAGLCSQ